MTDPRQRAPRRSRGLAMAESLIAMLFLWVVLGAAVELALLFRTKAALNHATLQAARSAMVANAEPQALVNGLARGLLPLFGPTPGLAGAAETLTERALPEVVQFARVRVLNPNRRAFDDFAESRNGNREIPNDDLHLLPDTTGESSGLSLQDANLLRVEVVYGAPLRIPIIADLLLATLQATGVVAAEGAFQAALLEARRVPVLATATVRMQSPARLSALVVP